MVSSVVKHRTIWIIYPPKFAHDMATWPLLILCHISKDCEFELAAVHCSAARSRADALGMLHHQSGIVANM